MAADAPNQASRAESEGDVAQTFLLRLSGTIKPLADATSIKEAAARLLATHLAADSALYFDVEREGQSFAATLTQGQTVVVQDINRHSLIIVPLLKGGQYVAGLAVVSVTPRHWTSHEVALAEQTAERTRAAIEHARARAPLDQSPTQAFLSRLVAVQEEERSRIARDIHDQLGQQVTALRMNLEALQLNAKAQPLAGQLERTQQLAEALDRSIDFLTRQLRPAALDHLELSAALEQFVTGWSERFGVVTEFQAGGDAGERLPRDVESNLYRIVQEALHNISRHPGDSHVSVLLERRDGGTLIVIEDNGSGFDPSAEDDGLGVGMRERATLAGGHLDIESSPGQGTTIFVRIPDAPPSAE